MITRYQALMIKQLAYECVLAVDKFHNATSREKAVMLKQKIRDAKEEALDVYLKEISVE